ncbi:D-amino-acid transaminase [Thalassobacillus sp. CUG 92003]|uniref:D-amino-acid transaminase n=1 Tax=Thalassobacillus sp. CUG 92003 TaxID=2736641 RepID=UPI0015E6B177|nr:D-amino-acid transaminase [Thalassobacillus sp. CUG 92003]
MSVKPFVLTENDFCKNDELTYPFEERGLQFGDGVYEVIRIYEGHYYLLNEHVDRLYRSADAIKINVPFKKQQLIEQLHKLLEKNQVAEDAKVYLQLTRGSAARDHTFPVGVDPNFYAYVQDFPRKREWMDQGVSAIIHDDVRWDLCYIKSLNLLPNVLAKQTAMEEGSFEAILHKNGTVTECSSSNVYLVKNGHVYTHPAKENILHGCVRMRVEQFCKDLGIPFIEEAFQVEDIQLADEIFLTSSTAEVMPIVKVDGKLINGAKPGPITQTLQQAYEQDAGITVNSVPNSVPGTN